MSNQNEGQNPEETEWEANLRRRLYSSQIISAALDGNVQEVKDILKEVPTLVNAINEADEQARAPLHAAAVAGHKDMAQLLLNLGANVDIRDNYGFTPLLYATAEGRLEIVALLLDHGANIEAKSTNLLDAVHIAYERGRDDGLYALLLTASVMAKKGMKLPSNHVYVDVLEAAILHQQRKGNPNVKKEDIDAALKEVFGKVTQRVTMSQNAPNSGSSTGYDKVYVRFPEPLERHSSQDWDAWSGHRTPQSLEFANDIEGVVLEMLAPYFQKGWILDGPYSTAVNLDSETKDVGIGGIFGTNTMYKGFWARLRRTR